MKQPDRFARMVDKLVGNHDGVQRMGITNAGAALLLRRQHRAVVRLVKQQVTFTPSNMDEEMIPFPGSQWIDRDDLLTALARRMQ